MSEAQHRPLALLYQGVGLLSQFNHTLLELLQTYGLDARHPARKRAAPGQLLLR